MASHKSAVFELTVTKWPINKVIRLRNMSNFYIPTMMSVLLALSACFTHLQEIATIKLQCNSIEELSLILI